MDWRVGLRRVGWVELVERRDINIGFPVLPTPNFPFCLTFSLLFNSHFSTLVPVELIFLQKFGGWEKWVGDQG
jgi:hypothetical protein